MLKTVVEYNIFCGDENPLDKKSKEDVFTWELEMQILHFVNIANSLHTEENLLIPKCASFVEDFHGCFEKQEVGVEQYIWDATNFLRTSWRNGEFAGTWQSQVMAVCLIIACAQSTQPPPWHEEGDL